jgi:hypothetical protein
MKLTYIVFLGAFVIGGYAQAQRQHAPATEQQQAVARACKSEAQHLCSGKTGQEAQQCLKANQDKLGTDCKNAMAKVSPSGS